MTVTVMRWENWKSLSCALHGKAYCVTDTLVRRAPNKVERGMVWGAKWTVRAEDSNQRTGCPEGLTGARSQ